eukprot:2875098-Prymnesium_polylepis.1
MAPSGTACAGMAGSGAAVATGTPPSELKDPSEPNEPPLFPREPSRGGCSAADVAGSGTRPPAILGT